jgi:probable H4MPT-linked C1 transfer pathway protein
MVKRCLGLDIGGANIKVADTDSYARNWPFAMWNRSEELPDFLGQVLEAAPAIESLAVTMTGELADCFSSKSQGVQAILNAVEQVATGKDVRVYQVDGNWATVEAARRDALSVAAANWHALARFVSRAAGEQNFLLVDVGSTTTDVIPIVAGAPSSRGNDDVSRLLAGELVYSGVERTPVCAVVESFPYRGEMCPLAAELFATMLDVYLVLGDLPESPGTEHTGDGKERSRQAAALRLSRMICADPEQFTESDAIAAAQWVAEAQAKRLAASIRTVLSGSSERIEHVFVSGHGDFLAHQALNQLGLPLSASALSERIGIVLSRSGPAYALAVLAAEEWVQ